MTSLSQGYGGTVSNLRHTAQSICVRGYRYLKYAPENAQANISSNIDDITEENVETPYMSIKDIFVKLTTGEVPVTDTHTGEQYRSARDFVMLNQDVNVSIPGRFLLWSAEMITSIGVPFSDVLDVIQNVSDSIHEGVYFVFSPPESHREIPRLCSVYNILDCSTDPSNIKVTMVNLTRACELLLGNTAGDLGQNVNDRSSVGDEPNFEEMVAETVVTDREEIVSTSSTRIFPASSTVSEKETVTTRQSSSNTQYMGERLCKHIIYQPMRIRKTPFMFSTLLKLDESGAISLTVSKGFSSWKSLRCVFEPTQQKYGGSKLFNSTSTCQVDVECTQGRIFVNEECLVPALVLLHASATHEASPTDFFRVLKNLIDFSGILNHPNMALWQDPSTCLTNSSTQSQLGNVKNEFFGTYHVLRSTFTNSTDKGIPLQRQLEETVALLELNNKTLTKPISTLRLCIFPRGKQGLGEPLSERIKSLGRLFPLAYQHIDKISVRAPPDGEPESLRSPHYRLRLVMYKNQPTHALAI
ncbi:hypothetical protein PoB_004707200 [Plakobranchus ocellatus]|uniref:Uncharacterized protein n=1 Tax=Plakobranchus ocellatus TaxID=259542 RepID=A0AAV4BNN6_9GAST|nr:hypothetical protein PoB_004707200 [Plakobranchus ocellatus]